MKILIASMLICSSAVADTHTYTRAAWLCGFTERGASCWEAPTAGGISYHFDGTGPGPDEDHGLDFGYDTLVGYSYWQSEYGQLANGLDQGLVATAQTLVVADPFNPFAPGIMITIMDSGPSLIGPIEESPGEIDILR